MDLVGLPFVEQDKQRQQQIRQIIWITKHQLLKLRPTAVGSFVYLGLWKMNIASSHFHLEEFR